MTITSSTRIVTDQTGDVAADELPDRIEERDENRQDHPHDAPRNAAAAANNEERPRPEEPAPGMQVREQHLVRDV
jgi:hypothetical protein